MKLSEQAIREVAYHEAGHAAFEGGVNHTINGSWLAAMSRPGADLREADGLAGADIKTQRVFASGHAH